VDFAEHAQFLAYRSGRVTDFVHGLSQLFLRDLQRMGPVFDVMCFFVRLSMAFSCEGNAIVNLAFLSTAITNAK
jgi:hypothetical protein